MKRTLLLFFTLVVATMGRNIIGPVAHELHLTKEEVEACFNETDVTSEDVMHYVQYIENGTRTADYDSVLKVSYFLACSMKKARVMTGAHINADKMKEIIHSSPRIVELAQIIDTCANQAKSGTNECEANLKFVLCFIELNKKETPTTEQGRSAHENK